MSHDESMSSVWTRVRAWRPNGLLCSFECRRLRRTAQVAASNRRKNERLRAARRLQALNSAKSAPPVGGDDDR